LFTFPGAWVVKRKLSKDCIICKISAYCTTFIRRDIILLLALRASIVLLIVKKPFKIVARKGAPLGGAFFLWFNLFHSVVYWFYLSSLSTMGKRDGGNRPLSPTTAIFDIQKSLGILLGLFCCFIL
jgi:hypothetical protein